MSIKMLSVAARHLRVKHVSLKLSSVPHTVQCGYKWSVKPGMIKESERVLSKSSCIVFDEDGIFFKRNYTELVLSDDGIWYYSFFWTRGVFLMLTAPKCRCNCRWCSWIWSETFFYFFNQWWWEDLKQRRWWQQERSNAVVAQFIAVLLTASFLKQDNNQDVLRWWDGGGLGGPVEHGGGRLGLTLVSRQQEGGPLYCVLWCLHFIIISTWEKMKL